MRSLLISCLVVLAAVTLLGGAPKAAASGGIGVSRDGVTWSPSLDSPLFDESIRWVPGDSRTGTFYVRNEGPSSARMSVDLLGQAQAALLDAGDLRVDARELGGEWRRIDGSGSVTLSSSDVQPGEGMGVEVRVSMYADATNASQLQPGAFNVRVRLEEPESPAGPGRPAPGELAWTGGSFPTVIMLVAAGSLLLGAVLLRRSRRLSEAPHGH